ncbi:hypothetical protein GO002_30085 [Streptomyces eurocidicus]|nr:hypothetical protein [Streptomyces eurocidicus]
MESLRGRLPADPTRSRPRGRPVRLRPRYTAEDTPSAPHRAAEPAGPGGLIVVFGSPRLVGGTRTALAPEPA